MPRKAHKYHYIYKTTCNVTGKYYIGMHSTSNLEDGYFGSGKRLGYSIKKYGRENHTVEILEWFPDRSSLKDREREIINQEMLDESLCMNLKLGGEGGFSNKEHQLKTSSAGGKANSDKIKNDPEHKAKFTRLANENRAKSIQNGTFKIPSWKGKFHTEESKRKMSESSKGKGSSISNSQFGTCWITNGIQNRKIRKGDSIPEGWSLGRKIK